MYLYVIGNFCRETKLTANLPSFVPQEGQILPQGSAKKKNNERQQVVSLDQHLLLVH